MSAIGKPERVTPDHVRALCHDDLGNRLPGDGTPNSRLQKYRLTATGRAWLENAPRP